jgi:hypothetical protein
MLLHYQERNVSLSQTDVRLAGGFVSTTAAPTPAAVSRNGAGPIEDRVARLRKLATEAPDAARDDAWAWIAELGRRVRRDRGEALAELDHLFRAGRPSSGIDGQTEGTLVTFTVHPIFDTTIAALTTAWLPWAGKRFDALAGTGDNLLLRSARWPAKLLWPLYGMRDAAERLAAFDFETRVEPGALDQDREVLVIDYEPVESNPRVVIRSIRDELVEVVPGAHLGKMLWRSGSGGQASHTLLAYFALKSELA